MRRPDIRMHNDGQDFICMDCGTVIPRTRSNPYPGHKCKTSKEKVLAKWPDAWCTDEHPFCVYLYQARGGPITGGIGGTEPEAWADAARRLK